MDTVVLIAVVVVVVVLVVIAIDYLAVAAKADSRLANLLKALAVFVGILVILQRAGMLK